MNYFENNQGLISKAWIKDYRDLVLELKIYDGNYIDQKVVVIQIEIENTASRVEIIQSNG